MAGRIADRHPALGVKDACLARSGVYNYTYDEMVMRGYTPSIKKPLYSEFRPPEVVARAKDLFAFAAVTKEHTEMETTPENFRLQASGIVGDNIVVKDMPDGNIGLFGKMAFYTKDAWDYYQAGNKETSADYRSVCVPDTTGQYDFILKDILSVNGVVVTARGRGGSAVRVMDSGNMFDRFGGNKMAGKKGVLGFLGIGRSKDTEFKLSKIVMDGIKTLHSLDSAGREKLAGEMMTPVMQLNESADRELLIGAVRDSVEHPVEVLAKEKEVSEFIDSLYTRCADSDAKALEEAVKGVVTKDSDEAKKKKEEDEKKAKEGCDDKKTKDTAPAVEMSKFIDDIVEKTAKRVGDSIGDMIDKKVSEALGVKPGDGKGKKEAGEGNTQDSIVDEVTREEASFLTSGSW